MLFSRRENIRELEARSCLLRAHSRSVLDSRSETQTFKHFVMKRRFVGGTEFRFVL